MPKPTKILVVEDEAAIRRLIRASLEPEGFEITEEDTAEAGLEHLEAGGFDLLVLDLALPKMSGWDLLEEMKRTGLRNQVRVVILTARSVEEDILRGWRMGVDHYCMKPFAPHDFVSVVRFVLSAGESELQRQREEELSKTQLLHMVDHIFDR